MRFITEYRKEFQESYRWRVFISLAERGEKSPLKIFVKAVETLDDAKGYARDVLAELGEYIEVVTREPLSEEEAPRG